MKKLKLYLFSVDVTSWSVYVRFWEEESNESATELILEINDFTIEEINELQQMNWSYVSEEWLLEKGFLQK